jgi:hypothetical protein
MLELILGLPLLVSSAHLQSFPSHGSSKMLLQAQQSTYRRVTSQRLGIAFDVPQGLRAAAINSGIALFSESEFLELQKDAAGLGSPHGAEEKLLIEVIKPIPIPGGSLADNFYSDRDYMRREGFNPTWSNLGGQKALILNQNIRCCYGDPYVAQYRISFSPANNSIIVLRSGRDMTLYRNVVKSFSFL